MHRLTILYGMPTDPQHFRDYYYATHIPLARKMQGLTGWNLSWIDPPSAPEPEPQRYLLVAELYASDAEAMAAVLASPEGQAASADVANFATGTVEFLAGDEEEVSLA